MQEKYLTLTQNTCAARIFLNTLGLTLENLTDIDEFSKIKVFDKDMNVVGELHFDNGKVIIVSNYNNSLLEASYDIAKVFSFIDRECGNALFGQWSSNIEFKVENSNNIKLSGEFLIGCSVDSEFGIKCLCHPLINCEVPNKGKITLKILRDGRTFGVEISSGKYKETIDIMPGDNWNGFIKHVISNGDYDPKRYMHEYRKYMGVFAAGKGNEDKLHVFLSETEWDNKISFRNEFPLKIGDDKSKELVIQKGMLMQDLDPDMFEKIKSLREVLSIGEISLLDNLLSICYDSYSDEELEALLGIKRSRMNYQDGANSLKESYFGIGQDSQFLSTEQQKRLLKTNRKNV